MEALRDYQIQDLAFYMSNERCANLSDPGTGKTPSVCVYMQWLWQKKQAKTYWAMPKSLLAKNKRELLRFTTFTESEVQIIDGKPNERAIQMANPNAKVFLMGFKRFSDDWQNIRSLHPQMNAVIVDEVHMGFKSHDSKRTKELFKCMNLIKHFLAMSGTLIDGRLDSCYPTIKIIEPRYYTNHWSFMAQHALQDEYGTVVGWVNHEKIGRIFKRHCIRRTFESVFGVQAKIIQHEICEMHEKQRAAYKEFEENAILELSDSFLEGFNPAVAAMRCRQIMAHPETFKLLAAEELTGKDEALLVHLENHRNTGEPLVIYATLQPEQERIYELCLKEGFKTALINGNVPTEKRAEIDVDFQNGEYQIIVGSPATAAVGFNWGHVNHIIFASLNYQNVDFVQAYRRAIRGVRNTHLWITILEYGKSIDQRIFEIVNRKSNDLNKVDETYERLDLGVNDEDESGGFSVPKQTTETRSGS